MPVGTAAKVATFGSFKRRVAEFRVASVALCDLRVKSCFCVTDAIVCRRCQKITFIFHGGRSTLDVSIFMLHGRRSTLDASCWVCFANRVVYTLHSTPCTPQFTLYTRHFALHNPHFTPCPTHGIPHSTLHCRHDPHSALHSVPLSTVYTGTVTGEKNVQDC